MKKKICYANHSKGWITSVQWFMVNGMEWKKREPEKNMCSFEPWYIHSKVRLNGAIEPLSHRSRYEWYLDLHSKWLRIRYAIIDLNIMRNSVIGVIDRIHTNRIQAWMAQRFYFFLFFFRFQIQYIARMVPSNWVTEKIKINKLKQQTTI